MQPKVFLVPDFLTTDVYICAQHWWETGGTRPQKPRFSCYSVIRRGNSKSGKLQIPQSTAGFEPTPCMNQLVCVHSLMAPPVLTGSLIGSFPPCMILFFHCMAFHVVFEIMELRDGDQSLKWEENEQGLEEIHDNQPVARQT